MTIIAQAKAPWNKVEVLPDGRRVCKGCGEAKPPSDYHKDSRSFDGRRAQCKPCRNGFMADYYADNREDRSAAVQAYRDENVMELRRRDMLRYHRDRDKRIELAKVHRYARRARQEGVRADAGITHTSLREKHGSECCYCNVTMTFERAKRGRIAPDRASIEHITPISLGGSHTWENTTLACHSCNTSRGNKPVGEWLAKRSLRE